MNGVVVLDKPAGISSRKAVDEVRMALKVKRAGHTGTLDPFATGVLPVCFGRATKIIPFLEDDFKDYEAVLRLGISTDTLDTTGEITDERKVGFLTRSNIERVLNNFRGKTSQIPPMYSAIKKNGMRLYKLARQGKEVARSPREVVIRELKLLGVDLPFVRFFVKCSRGTYVRVLGSDIGNKLGCGAHLVELRRTASDGFKIENAVSIQDIKNGDCGLISMQYALHHIDGINVGEAVAEDIRNGKQIIKSHLRQGTVPCFSTGDKLKISAGPDLVAITEALVNSSDLDKVDDENIVLKLLRVFN